ncbi:coniferyl-alcohol dehydrogenase [Haloechinothrix sp. YIM 98757]|uniref:Coniferyl-alcohol dehydrogenase n=1 Tax=Haloechinothrix aidingensis TaxID=2752311 RepID=A0A838AC53_9PSEU|nr:coniferyl-alcohol dehydrogenase [Haloechinothrix aidingensis]MBA0126842.1 coniferyl-alcohol dehydrogenase [Haloechinothrix aidingensis]
MTSVNDLRCIVTGAASGIGHAVAEQLLKGGAEVTSLDRNEPSAGVQRHLTVDLADPDSIDTCVHELGGGWDALINVAGVPGTAPAELVFKVNFLGLRHLTESLFGRFNTGGAIVNVSSTAGFQWSERLGQHRDLITTESFHAGLQWYRDNPHEGNAYNFAKEAVTVYTMAMGTGLAAEGLRMNAVLPGPVNTPILPDFETSMGKDTLDGVKFLLGRHAEPDDIAPAAAFLASPESRWINGHPLVVDGGITGAVLTGLVPPPEL